MRHFSLAILLASVLAISHGQSRSLAEVMSQMMETLNEDSETQRGSPVNSDNNDRVRDHPESSATNAPMNRGLQLILTDENGRPVESRDIPLAKPATASPNSPPVSPEASRLAQYLAEMEERIATSRTQGYADEQRPIAGVPLHISHPVSESNPAGQGASNFPEGPRIDGALTVLVVDNQGNPTGFIKPDET